MRKSHKIKKKRSLVIILIILVILILMFFAFDINKKLKAKKSLKFFKEGKIAFSNGNYKDALKNF